MHYTVKTPAIVGDTCNLASVAHAMALQRSTARGEFDEKTYDTVLPEYSSWLLKEARSGRLRASNSLGVPTSWAALMGKRPPTDASVACTLVWVNLAHLNQWAETVGHVFTVDSAGVLWFEDHGVVGGQPAEPPEQSVSAQTHDLDSSTHPESQSSAPHLEDQSQGGEFELETSPPARTPDPLTTTEIAECFNGLAGRDTRGWKDFLGKMPKWIEMCLVTHGSRGGSRGGRERRWNPVMLGLALVKASKAKRSSVRGRFQVRPELDSWKDEWMKAEWQLPEE